MQLQVAKVIDERVIIKMGEFPVLFIRKEDCCGCTACYAICPRKAIRMIPDEKGFEYPHINKEKCIHCNQCVRVCPIKNNK